MRTKIFQYICNKSIRKTHYYSKLKRLISDNINYFKQLIHQNLNLNTQKPIRKIGCKKERPNSY